MTRQYIANFLAVTVMVAVFFWAMSMVPARAAECQQAVVSWYGTESGNRTADGTPFDGTQMVVAHRSMAFGTRLRFTYAGRSVEVRVADRGPFIAGRTFDLSMAAFSKLAHTDRGVIRACWERVR